MFEIINFKPEAIYKLSRVKDKIIKGEGTNKRGQRHGKDPVCGINYQEITGVVLWKR